MSADNNSATLNVFCQNLRAAPMSISILGELTLIAGRRDFSLITKENQKFEHLKNPESFSASVIQVSNTGYKAFQNAHVAINDIARKSKLMPGFMREIQTLLLSGYAVHGKLDAIKEMANHCEEISSKVAID